MNKLVNFIFKNKKIVIKKYQEDGENIVICDLQNPKIAVLPEHIDTERNDLTLLQTSDFPIPFIVTEEEAKLLLERKEQEEKKKQNGNVQDNIFIEKGEKIEEGED